MAGRTIKPDSQENRLSDADFEQWETISSDFGTKLTWGDGSNGTCSEFVGNYLGTNVIPIGEPDEDGNPLDSMSAAEFVDSNGEKFYCWINFALGAAIEKGEMQEGDTVRITYLGESPTKRGLNPVKKLGIQRKPRA